MTVPGETASTRPREVRSPGSGRDNQHVPTLEALVESHGGREFHRACAQETYIWTYLTPAWKRFERAIANYDDLPTGQLLATAALHHHVGLPDVPCLDCMLHQPGITPFERHLIAASLDLHHTDTSDTFPTRKRALQRVRLARPTEAHLATLYGVYWYDYVSLALHLEHCRSPEEVRHFIDRACTADPVSLVTPPGEGRDDEWLDAVWLAKVLVSRHRPTRGGLPLRSATRSRVRPQDAERIAGELYARRNGGRAGTDTFDPNFRTSV